MENIIASFYNVNEIVIHPNAEAPVILEIDGKKVECPIQSEVGRKFIKLPHGISFATTMHFKISWPGQRQVDVDNFGLLKDSQVFMENFHDNQPVLKVTDKKTVFKLFAPSALKVTVRVLSSNDHITEHEMIRKDGGVWEKSISQKLTGYFQFKVTKYNGQKEIVTDSYAQTFKNDNWASIHEFEGSSKIQNKNEVTHNSLIVNIDTSVIKGKTLSYLYKKDASIKYIHGPKYFQYIGVTHVLVRNIFNYENNRPFSLIDDQTYEELSEFTSHFEDYGIGTIIEIKLDEIIKSLHSITELEMFYESNKALMLSAELAEERILDKIKKLVQSIAINGVYISNFNSVPDSLIQKVIHTIKSARKHAQILSDVKLTADTIAITQELKKITVGEGTDAYGMATGSSKVTTGAKYFFNTLTPDESIKVNYVLSNKEPILKRLERTNAPENKKVHISRAKMINGLFLLSNNAKMMNLGDELISETSLFTWDKVESHKQNIIWFVELNRMINNLKSYLNGYIECTVSQSGSMLVNEFKLRGDEKAKVVIIANPSVNQYYYSNPKQFIEIFNDFGSVDEKTKMKDMTVEPLSIAIIAITDATDPQLMTLNEIIQQKDRMLNIQTGDDRKLEAAAKHAEQNIKTEKIEMINSMYEKLRQTGQRAKVVAYKSIVDAKDRASKIAQENITTSNQEGVRTMAEKQKEALKKIKVKTFK